MDVTVPCPCPGTPHPDGDTVTLRDTPSFPMGATALGWAAQAGPQPASAEISVMFMREGIVAWTFVNDDGSGKEVDDEGLTWFLDDFARAYPVAEASAALYTDAIFAPLQEAAQKSSRTGRTARSTSAKSRPTSSPPSP